MGCKICSKSFNYSCKTYITDEFRLFRPALDELSIILLPESDSEAGWLDFLKALFSCCI